MNQKPQMDEEARQALNERLAEFSDWRGTCHKCGLVIVGTLADLEAHAAIHAES